MGELRQTKEKKLSIGRCIWEDQSLVSKNPTVDSERLYRWFSGPYPAGQPIRT